MKFFHIDWLPRTRWGYRLVRRFDGCRDPSLRDRAKQHWPAEQMIAFATRLALIRVIQRQFNEDIAALSKEFEKKTAEIQKCIPEHKALRLKDSDLAFRLVAGIDAFIFEARSLYEILGVLVSRIAGNVLGIKVDERALRKIVGVEGHDTSWIDDLRDERIRFFHETSPWLAVKMTDGNPPYEILVLRRNAYDLEADVDAAFPLGMLNRIFFGLNLAVDMVEKWLLERIDEAEKTALL